MNVATNASSKPLPLLLTRLEAAEFLRLSPRKVDQLAASGELPKVKIGACVRFYRDDLEAFVAGCRTA